MLKLPLKKLYFLVKLCFLFVLVLITLSLFEYWRGGKRATRAVIVETDEDILERQILEDEARIIPGLGEGGRPAYLTGEDKLLGEETEKKYAINTYLSDRIAYNRTLKDFRNPACERVVYDAELPSTSVIIIFHNEPYSVVVRTLWSVLNTARRDQPWHRRANYLERGTGRVMKLGYPGQPEDSEHVYLKEIILVDDNSTLPELRGKLARYIRTRLPRDIVRVLRLPDRIGLTRARLAGARYASGDVLIFLDAHCEGVLDWMRPMLQRIKDSPTAVVMPIIDVIEHKDFLYSVQDPVMFQGLMRARVTGARAARGDVLVFLDAHCEAERDWLRPLLQRLKHKRDAVATPVIDVVDQTSFHLDGEDPIQVGGFTFVGHFTWIDVPERERQRRGSDISPTWSPTMAGGLFAIRRAYYWELGAYDEQMAGWGGENLEMSFRIWQCGGTLETIPCSRVGHVFRAFHPYGLPANSDTHGINTARMAEVWMDDYAELFYLHRPDLRKNPKIGDVTHRKILREKLHCKSFQWFLDNVYQEKYVPVRDSQAFGRVKNAAMNLCLDSMQREGEGTPLGFYPCHPQLTDTQFLSLSLAGQLRDEERCAEVQFVRSSHLSGDEENTARAVVLTTCRDKFAAKVQWRHLPATGQLQHADSGLCLDARGARAGDDARARACADSPAQRWTFDYDGDDSTSGVLPLELEQKLKKIKGQRRMSRSLLAVSEEDEGAAPTEKGAGPRAGEGAGRRRANKRRRRSKRKQKQKVHKNKFIVTVERTLSNNSVEHLEMDIHCKHRKLYPNNSFVRDLVSILNDRDIRVINNGRVFEKNRVIDLKDHLRHAAERAKTTAAPFYETPEVAAEKPWSRAPPPPPSPLPHAEPDAITSTPKHTKAKKRRHKKRGPNKKPRDRSLLLPGEPGYNVLIGGGTNGTSVQLRAEGEGGERHLDVDARAQEQRAPWPPTATAAPRPDSAEPAAGRAPEYALEPPPEGRVRAREDAIARHAEVYEFQKMAAERPGKTDRGKVTAQILSDAQAGSDGERHKPEHERHTSENDSDANLWDPWAGRADNRHTADAAAAVDARKQFPKDPHEEVSKLVFEDVWARAPQADARVSELARQVMMQYDEPTRQPIEHKQPKLHFLRESSAGPSRGESRAKHSEAGKPLRVRVKSNMTFNLGEDLLNWRRMRMADPESESESISDNETL